MVIGFVLLGVYATPSNGCRVWKKSCLALPQGGEMYPGLLQEL